MAPLGEGIGDEWKSKFLSELSTRPSWLTEVRRDGKDAAAVTKVIKAEFDKRSADLKEDGKSKFVRRMEAYATACWSTCEAMHLLMLDDEQPENEKARLDPDHWYEVNLTNALLFANLTLDGLDQLVPGRLFSTRMPRNIVEDEGERNDFIDKCKVNDLRVILVLTEPEEFKKYSGMDGLLEFYREECGLVVYNRAIPDFQIPTSGDLVDNILDLTYHLAKGRNCLVHCAGGSGRTGMVIAAIVKNLGVYDPVARIRRVKSTYVETYEQELFLKNVPKAIDSRIVREKPLLAKAIAAEQLLQVFVTHGEKAGSSSSGSEEGQQESTDQLEADSKDKLRTAYLKTFDMLDQDGSGTLDRDEVTQWLNMCGSELDVDKVLSVMMGDEDQLERDRFADLMCTKVASSRREYDIGGSAF
eukprot:TRINITY_DN12376_c0_g1_i2.p1 TRINITY_DN12376_c0_g1~~TRINITY_DN12376_c0_g1_i2.p1  ORF type:complete len:430 (-),score=138.60 TRINITY_DN12376_c0_g1_i2:255-1499(-)